MAEESSNVLATCLPSWLNNAFLEKVLRSEEGDTSVTVISSEVKKATAAGDNYASEMYRATVQIKGSGSRNEERSIIIKASPANEGEMNKVLIEANIYGNEIKVYTIIFPAMLRQIDQIGTWKHQPFAAKCLYSYTDNLTKVLAMEDLQTQGFRLANTDLGLDLSHCLLVVRNIAKFHALSVVLYNKNPEMFKPFMSNIIEGELKKGIDSFLQRFSRSVAKEVDMWQEGNLNRFSRSIYELAEKGGEEWILATKRNDSEFNVLIHGDLWANNMMFRYSEETGEVKELRFVDFQLSQWTSAAVDLQYFFNTSAAPEVLENVEVLIEEYYTSLSEALQLLGHQHLQPQPTQLRKDFEKRGLFGIIAATSVRILALSDRTRIYDLNRNVEPEETTHLSDAFKESLKKLIPFYERRGWLKPC